MNRKVEFYHLRLDNSDRYSRSTTERHIEVTDICPRCGYNIVPQILSSVYVGDGDGLGNYVVTMHCPHCLQSFMAEYRKHSSDAVLLAPQALPYRSFDDKLKLLSPRFVETFNQSLAAESMSLSEIAGMGYRKSIEFLIKDYLVMRNPDESESIQKEALGSCINNRIDNALLKTTAQRAVWLGNDFTHYTRKYEDCDLSTMKSFIDATVHWILMELITDDASSLDRR